jgi:type II secretory ATPase GspE/PulE/Tfp pilus assembly ATPase PilB-like protein
VFELMIISDPIRELILKSASAGQLRDAARREGLRSLSEDGWRLVTDGVTTVDEVLRTTKDAVRITSAADFSPNELGGGGNGKLPV